jgi:DNA-binding SARP family transcriptional activator
MLRIRVLGKLELELDGEPLSIPRGRRLQSLLAWLVLHPGLRDRGEVAGSLWPDVLDESARASLRGALALLRRELGEEASRYVVATRERVGISPDALDRRGGVRPAARGGTAG